MTAKEFLKNIKHKSHINNVPYYSPITIRKVMIEFAKHHVQKALEAVSKDSYIVCSQEEKGCVQCWGGGCEDPIICKDSILNAYPLENIK